MRRLNPAVPADLATIMTKALAKEPSHATKRPGNWPATWGDSSKAGRSWPVRLARWLAPGDGAGGSRCRPAWRRA